MEHVDTWSEYAFIISIYALFLAALLLAIWKAVTRRFSPYWTTVISLLVLGPPPC
ncbi:HAMP domain-containing protein [Ensifer sp. WSM1721]